MSDETIAFASTPAAITRAMTRAMTTVMRWRYVAETGGRVTEKVRKSAARPRRNGAPAGNVLRRRALPDAREPRPCQRVTVVLQWRSPSVSP